MKKNLGGVPSDVDLVSGPLDSDWVQVPSCLDDVPSDLGHVPSDSMIVPVVPGLIPLVCCVD